MRSLVTGATGYIGRRLVDALLFQGHEVTALSRSRQQDLPQAVRTLRADVEQPESLQALQGPFDRVYHLAARVSFAPNAREELMAANFGGTQNVLAACRGWGAGRVVVASSACTLGLGASSGEILDESRTAGQQLQQRNPYLASKLAAEGAVRDAAQDLHAVIVNPTTVYGPGDWSLNSGTLLLKVARGKVLPVPSGGSNVVDVDDVVCGIIAAGEHGRPGERYVLGGWNMSFAEIVDTICDVVGQRPLRVPLGDWARPLMQTAAWFVGKATGSRLVTPQLIGDLFAWKFYSSHKALQELGWQAETGFAQSAARAWEFYRENGLA